MRDDQLGGVLDSDQTLMRRDRRNQRLGQGGLARAGCPGNEDIAAGPHSELEEVAPGARFFQGEQSVLVGGKLVAGGADLIEQFCLLESIKRHGQCRWLADRETEYSRG